MKLNLGCGRKKLPGFINVDADRKVNPDHLSDIRKLSKNFGRAKAEEVRAYHIIEHLSKEDGEAVVRECSIVLKEGGRFYLELPEFDGVLREYLLATKQERITNPLLKARIFGLQRTPHDFHLWGYTFAEVRELLTLHGFKGIKRLSTVPSENPSTFGWHGGPCIAVEAYK